MDQKKSDLYCGRSQFFEAADGDGPRPDVEDTFHVWQRDDTVSSVLLLADVMSVMIQPLAVLLTKQPKYLMVSNNISFDYAPFRVSLLVQDTDHHESSTVDPWTHSHHNTGTTFHAPCMAHSSCWLSTYADNRC